MKKNNFLAALSLFALLIAVQTATAQITINIPNIPKIPKIKKTKPDAPKPDDNQTTPDATTTTTNNQTTTDASDHDTATQDAKNDDSAWLSLWLDDIKKIQTDVEEYTPETKLYLARRFQDNYLLLAVSKKARDKWAKDKQMQDWRTAHPGNKLDAALDALNTALASKLPTYRPNNKFFQVRNPAAEKLVMESLAHTGSINVSTVKVYKIGTDTVGWSIQKDGSGFPSYRYKYASVYFRDTSEDHPYCHLVAVTIKQDYAGGGTYNSEIYRSSADDNLFGCPATGK